MELTRRLTLAVILILGIAFSASILIVVLSLGTGTSASSSTDELFPFWIFTPIWACGLILIFVNAANKRQEET